jgi:hypothetical protein
MSCHRLVDRDRVLQSRTGDHQGMGITITADLNQSMLALISTKPAPIYFGRVVVDPPEVRSRVDCLGFVDPPCCLFDQMKYVPSKIIIEPSTGMAEGAACAVRPTNAATGRKPPTLKSRRHPFEKVQAIGRDLESIENTSMAAAQKHAVDVEIQQWIGVRRHGASAI